MEDERQGASLGPRLQQGLVQVAPLVGTQRVERGHNELPIKHPSRQQPLGSFGVASVCILHEDLQGTGRTGTSVLPGLVRNRTSAAGPAGPSLCLLDTWGQQRSRPTGHVFEQRDSECSLRTRSVPKTPTTARWTEAQECPPGLGAREPAPQTRPFRRGAQLTAPDVTPVGRPVGAPAAGRKTSKTPIPTEGTARTQQTYTFFLLT